MKNVPAIVVFSSHGANGNNNSGTARHSLGAFRSLVMSRNLLKPLAASGILPWRYCSTGFLSTPDTIGGSTFLCPPSLAAGRNQFAALASGVRYLFSSSLPFLVARRRYNWPSCSMTSSAFPSASCEKLIGVTSRRAGPGFGIRFCGESSSIIGVGRAFTQALGRNREMEETCKTAGNSALKFAVQTANVLRLNLSVNPDYSVRGRSKRVCGD